MATDFLLTACLKSKNLCVESNFDGVTPPISEDLLPVVVPLRYFPSAACNQHPDLEALTKIKILFPDGKGPDFYHDAFRSSK